MITIELVVFGDQWHGRPFDLWNLLDTEPVSGRVSVGPGGAPMVVCDGRDPMGQREYEAAGGQSIYCDSETAPCLVAAGFRRVYVDGVRQDEEVG